jgi:hypothetical protein
VLSRPRHHRHRHAAFRGGTRRLRVGVPLHRHSGCRDLHRR